MNYTVTFQDGTTTTFKSKRNLSAVVAYVRADGKHDEWSRHASRNAAAKFVNSAQAARYLDQETVLGLREDMTDNLREKMIREHEEYNARPGRPMRFYVADAVTQD